MSLSGRRCTGRSCVLTLDLHSSLGHQDSLTCFPDRWRKLNVQLAKVPQATRVRSGTYFSSRLFGCKEPTKKPVQKPAAIHSLFCQARSAVCPPSSPVPAWVWLAGSPWTPVLTVIPLMEREGPAHDRQSLCQCFCSSAGVGGPVCTSFFGPTCNLTQDTHPLP